MSRVTRPETLQKEFVRVLRADVDAGQVRPLDEYLERFPGCEDFIREEYALAVASSPGTESLSLGFLAPALPPRMRPAARPSVPDSIGRYRVIRLLARGGQGLVYLAEDPELGRRVVIKTLSVGLDPDGLARLRREARLTGRIDHPAVCSVLDVLDIEGQDYVILPFIDGETLQARIARHRAERPDRFPVSISSVGPDSQRDPSGNAGTDPAESTSIRTTGDLRSLVRFMETVALAVHEAHEKGVIHRDLKPGNIMIKANGDPVVLDFGLALDETVSTRMTQQGTTLGTPSYMAPEQVRGDLGRIGRTTDVYSLGVVLYELITGRLPYEGHSVQTVFQKILTGEPPYPRKLNPEIPRDLEAVCLMALDVEPRRRYPIAADLARDLRNVRTLRPTVARPPSLVGRMWRRLRRNPWVSGLAFIGLMLLIVAIYTTRGMLIEREKNDDLGALRRIVLARQEDRDPDPADVDRLRRILPGKVLEVFLENPLDSGVEGSLFRMIRERGAGEAAAEDRLIAPRATVADPMPVFRFPIPGDAVGMTFLIKVVGNGQSIEEKVVAGESNTVPAEGETRLMTTRLSTGALQAGGDWTWSVSIEGVDRKVYGPEEAVFRIMPPAEKTALVKSMPTFDRPATDRLLRAALLIAHDLAEDAVAELAAFPDDATREERILRFYQLARAKSVLRDAGAVKSALARMREAAAGR